MAVLAPVAALLSGCEGPTRYLAQENWNRPPDIRIALVSLRNDHRVAALAGTAAFDIELPDSFERGDKGEVWMFGYSQADIIDAFPPLAGKQNDEIAALLKPIGSISPVWPRRGGRRSLRRPPTS